MTSSPHISRDIIGWAHRKIEALEEQTRHGNAGYFNTIDLASFRDLVEQLESLLKVAEGLFQMIDRETWRATGGDDQQGHYEGDYRAAQIEEYLIFNGGAPSHIDLWDPQPDAPAEVRGSFSPIKTNVPESLTNYARLTRPIGARSRIG